MATPDFFREAGHEDVPGAGALSVSVPGAVAAWDDALKRFGTMTLDQVLAPAIAYARDGFPVASRLASDIKGASGGLNAPAKALYNPNGRAAEVGTLLRNGALAVNLEAIAKNGKGAFYEGVPSRAISGLLEAEGGYLREADFAAHSTTWTEPLETSCLMHRILVLPPNTQGIAQLQLMEMAKAHGLDQMGHNTADYLHTLIELKKLAFADRDRWVADPEHAVIPVDALLDLDYLRGRAELVGPRAAEDVTSGIVDGSGAHAQLRRARRLG